MTFDSMLLSFYILHYCIPYIPIVEDSHAHVVGTVNIDLEPSFKLQYVVLHVHTLYNILILIYELTCI